MKTRIVRNVQIPLRKRNTVHIQHTKFPTDFDTILGHFSAFSRLDESEFSTENSRERVNDTVVVSERQEHNNRPPRPLCATFRDGIWCCVAASEQIRISWASGSQTIAWGPPPNVDRGRLMYYVRNFGKMMMRYNRDYGDFVVIRFVEL